MLIDPTVAAPDPEAFPKVWEYGDLGLPLEYEFDPTSPDDGMTVDIPLQGLDRIDPAVFEWHVPGYREELVTELIRSLPKKVRKNFAPVPDTARRVLDTLSGSDDPGLLQTLRRELQRIGNEPIPVDAFDLDSLPAHLRPTFRIVDEDGNTVVAGQDLRALKNQVREETAAAVDATTHELETIGTHRMEHRRASPHRCRLRRRPHRGRISGPRRRRRHSWGTAAGHPGRASGHHVAGDNPAAACSTSRRRESCFALCSTATPGRCSE